MICTNTDHYVNTLSTIKKEKKRKKKRCQYTGKYLRVYKTARIDEQINKIIKKIKFADKK